MLLNNGMIWQGVLCACCNLFFNRWIIFFVSPALIWLWAGSGGSGDAPWLGQVCLQHTQIINSAQKPQLGSHLLCRDSVHLLCGSEETFPCDAPVLRCVLTGLRSSLIRYQARLVLTYLASDWSLHLKLRFFQNKRDLDFLFCSPRMC